MIDEQNSLPTTMQDAQHQILTLRRQLGELQAQNRAMWALLAEVSRKLQASATSIKAAASSLLDRDIFWDGSNQHEFLETIDYSVDQGTNLITLMMLAFRSEAGSLEMKPEPHILQEILSTVLDTLSVEKPTFRFHMVLPATGSPALVDYEYLAVGLRLLLEVLIESAVSLPELELRVVEDQDAWRLDLLNVPEPVIDAIDYLCQGRFDDLMSIDRISPESLLKLFTVSRILGLQHIHLKIHAGEEGKAYLRLTMPIASTT